MKQILFEGEELSKEKKVEFLMDMVHRLIFHHVFWFKEVEHQFGFEKALEVLTEVLNQAKTVHTRRIEKELGVEFKEGLPLSLINMKEEDLLKIMETVAKMWIANDGMWFLNVEKLRDMNDAKRCNDSCWCWFSPFEAYSIKRVLNLPERGGLEALKKALKFRVYAFLNVQEIKEPNENTLEFYMKQCRVQVARKRKGLPDYPCKSAGLVEYARFAQYIDERIETECIGCPPDEHPEEWFCAWRFHLKK